MLQKIKIIKTITDDFIESFALDFSQDGNHIIHGGADGVTRIYPLHTKKQYKKIISPYQNAITGLCFHPQLDCFIQSQVKGQIQKWDPYSSQLKQQLLLSSEIYSLKYSNDGSFIAAAGKDREIHIIDNQTFQEVQLLSDGNSYLQTPGHSNKIFGLAYDSINSNIIYSGGWDNTIQIWDTRIKKSVQSITGVQICGDAIDTCQDKLLVGSWRTDHSLQIYDLRMMQKQLVTSYEKDVKDFQEVPIISDIQFNKDIGIKKINNSQQQNTQQNKINQPTLCYTCRFNQSNSRQIFGAGSGGNSLKIFDWETNTVLRSYQNKFSIYCSACTKNGDFGAIAGDSFGIQIFNFNQ